MSGNNKPIYIGNDGAIYNSWEEKNQADARYKQHKQQLNELENLRAEQERANELTQQLAQQQIDEERANAERIAQATVQAEKEKALYQAILQQQQHNFEEEQRKIRLCDDLGVDYEEIKLFEDYLSNGDNSIIEKIDSLNKVIEYKEKSLKEYRNNKPNEQDITRKYNSKITTLQYKANSISRGDGLSVIYQIAINFFLVIAVGIFLTLQEENANWNMIIISFIIFNIVYSLFSKMKQKINASPIRKEIKELENKRDKELKEFRTNKEKILLNYNERVSGCTKELEESKQEKEKLEKENIQLQINKHTKFMEFRTTHYNEEMEMLLKKLKLQSLTTLDKAFELQNGYIEECANKKGTVKDYIKYIREVIRNN